MNIDNPKTFKTAYSHLKHGKFILFVIVFI